MQGPTSDTRTHTHLKTAKFRAPAPPLAPLPSRTPRWPVPVARVPLKPRTPTITPAPPNTVQTGPGGRRAGSRRGAPNGPSRPLRGTPRPVLVARVPPRTRPTSPAPSSRSGGLHLRQQAERAAFSPRCGCTPERQPTATYAALKITTKRRPPAGSSPATRRAPPQPPARAGRATPAGSRRQLGAAAPGRPERSCEEPGARGGGRGG